MKLADDYAEYKDHSEYVHSRAALQSAIEALQGEVEQVKGFWKEAQLRNRNLLEESNDLAFLADQYKAERDALQAKLDATHAVLDSDDSKIVRNAADGYPEGREPRELTLSERVEALCTYATDWKRWCEEVQAKLDELQRQEPVIDFTVLHQFASDQAISYNKLCTAVRMCLAAPKALEPLTDEQSATLFQAVKDDPRSAKFSVQNWFTCGLVTAEAAHGITKGTP